MSLEPSTVGVRARSVNENKPSPIQEKGARTKEQEGWVCEHKDSMTEKGRGGGEGERKNKTLQRPDTASPNRACIWGSLFTPHSLRMALLSILL